MQYAKDFTDALQFMWGEGFLSPGGPEEVAEMVAGIDLGGRRVLDIGSGLGGVDIALRLHEAGMIKSSPQKIIADGADWRFLDELKRELKM